METKIKELEEEKKDLERQVRGGVWRMGERDKQRDIQPERQNNRQNGTDIYRYRAIKTDTEDKPT